MKTKQHTIRGASLENIERLSKYGEPDFVPYIVEVPGTETSALDAAMVNTMHFSGLLRSVQFAIEGTITLIDDEGGKHDLEWMLDEAAERLDQAHEEWLEQRRVLDEMNKLSNTIDVEVRNVYGIDRFYPVNEKAKTIAEMMYGRKTLNQDDLIKLAEVFHFEIRLTNAVAHKWLPMAKGLLGVQA